MKKLIKNNKAATAVEFAIIAPVFFLLLIGIIEIGLTMFMQSSLDTGLHAYARKFQSQSYSSGGADTGPEGFINFMKDYTGGMFDFSRAAVTVRLYNEFSDLAPDAACFKQSGPDVFFSGINDGTANNADVFNCASGKLVLYGVKYRWGGITNLLSPYIPDHLYSFALVRNEDVGNLGTCTSSSNPIAICKP